MSWSAGALASQLVDTSDAAVEPADDLHGLEKTVDGLVRDMGVKPGEPGIAVLLLKPDRLLLRKGYGIADMRTRAPITPLTRFELASVTKTFTATAVLMLQERGALSIDDDVRKFLPELPRYESTPLRLVDMLHHISGLPAYWDLKNVPMRNSTYWVSEDYPAEFARQRTQFPLRFPIGARYEYNNSNFLLMSIVIQRVAKKPYARFMHEEIFARAGMADTFVYDGPASVPRNTTNPSRNNALGYDLKDSRWVESWGTTPERHEQHLEAGDGAIWTNLEDMARWDAAIRAHALVKPETMKLALTPSTTRDGTTNAYGLGWELFINRRGDIYGFADGGRWGGFETRYHNHLSNNHTVVLLSNRGPSADLMGLWRNLDAAIQTYAKG
jgi:CubicO group peptidase (beta-lactamase class C family)